MTQHSHHIIFLLLLTFNLFSQPQDIQFEHITMEDGLSNNCVICILQDRTGFMWFGTAYGLNRWDGYTFKTFTHDLEDSNSISDNLIKSLHEDSSGRIWVATNNGLNVYDPSTENFSRYTSSKNNPNSISHNIVNQIFEDARGNLWIGTEEGLNRYHPESDNFIRYFFEGQLDSVSFWWNNNTIRAINQDDRGRLLLGTTNDFLIYDPQTNETTIIPYVIPGRKRWPSVDTIYKDRMGKFWIGISNDGLINFDSKTGEILLYKPEPDNPYSFGSLFSTSICEDTKGRLWIGTADQGIRIFYRSTSQFIHYKSQTKNENSYKGYYVWCIYQDIQGNIWIGTDDSGINLVPKWKKPFKHYVHDPQNPNSLARGEVTNFYEDRDGILWIAHFLGGVSLLNKNTGNFTHITYNPRNPAGMSGGAFYGICEDRYGYIWFAITPDINRLNPKTGVFHHYHYRLSDPKSHAFTFTLCCYEDRRGTMWFGTSNAGLEKLNRSDETFDRFCYDATDSKSISDNCIYTIFQDRTGCLWIGTGNGLCQLVYDVPRKENFIRYLHDPAKPQSISGKMVLSMYEDRTGRFWIGTDAGLNLFDREKLIFEAITQKDGLPSNTIMGIVEDDQGLSENKAGNLWLRTPLGIVKFDPETRRIRVYDEGDGLIYCKSIQEGYRAFYKAKSGEIYSGGATSVAVFHPDSLGDNPDPPKIVFTDFKINYESAKISTNSPLQKSVTFTEQIKLAHHQNIISIEFAVLDYTSPHKNLYAYKMEGVNPDWVYTSASQRLATYTNLDPGEYLFRVKGSNNDGVWNEKGVTLRIIITPPFWKSVWAYGFYLMFLGLSVILIWRFQLKRIQVKNQLKMERFESQKLQELDSMKSRFFANISHEFRTPLTLILGPISQMFPQTRRSDFRENLSMMKRNALRLQRLINQLLDLSKLEAGKMKLQVQEENIVSLLRSFVQAFESLAKLKKIKLAFKSSQENIKAYIDREKLETIVNNLMSNAFKFTLEGGTVLVDISLPPLSIPPLDKGGKTGGVVIQISDTGTGIPADRLPHIFDRFYQVDDSYTKEQEGSGIGLALTKELVEFHQGEIFVSSQVGKGTTFVIQLPIAKTAYRKDEIVEPAAPLFLSWPEQEEKGSPETVETETQPIMKSKIGSRKSLPILLVVEDNPDMRMYIRNNLENVYRIIEAEDGQEGFKKCTKALPDLVISDVMMPKMDGFQLCSKLKQDERTSHIPVILLTARAATEDKIGGLETGADDYIIKPFNAPELKVRVKNLIEQRRKLRERFRKEGILQPQEIAVTSTDQKFLQRALKVVEAHISDERFSVVRFGKEVGMSRALLHRKLRALIDYSPSEFIRSIRLNHAARLLTKHSGNVTEIAYQVGFNHLSYFSKCFQRQFGVSPSLYAAKYPQS